MCYSVSKSFIGKKSSNCVLFFKKNLNSISPSHWELPSPHIFGVISFINSFPQIISSTKELNSEFCRRVLPIDSDLLKTSRQIKHHYDGRFLRIGTWKPVWFIIVINSLFFSVQFFRICVFYDDLLLECYIINWI